MQHPYTGYAVLGFVGSGLEKLCSDGHTPVQPGSSWRMDDRAAKPPIEIWGQSRLMCLISTGP